MVLQAVHGVSQLDAVTRSESIAGLQEGIVAGSGTCVPYAKQDKKQGLPMQTGF